LLKEQIVKRTRGESMGLFSKPDFEQLKRKGDTAAIIKASRSLRPSVKFGAIKAMIDLADPGLAPVMIEAYVMETFPGEHRPLRDAIEAFLLVAAPELVIAEAENRMGGAPGNLLGLVEKIDSDMARAFVAKAASRETFQQCCNVSKGSDVKRIPVSVRLKLVVGVSPAATYVYLTPSPAMWPDSETIKLPETCALCGCFKGHETGRATCSFQARTGVSLLVGISAAATAVIDYPLCGVCRYYDEKTRAIVLESVVRSADNQFNVNLQVLNPEVAASIRLLNPLP